MDARLAPMPKALRGFTLTELMAVIAIVAILAAVASPAMSRFIDNQRVRNGSFDLVSDLLLARSEAINKRTVVVITPVETGSEGWSRGWTLNLGTSTGTLVTSRTGVADTLRFDAKDSGDASLGSLSIGADGRVQGQTPVRINVTLAGTAPSWLSPSCIVIDATGRPKSEKGACS